MVKNSWETDSSLVDQDISLILWVPEILYCVYNFDISHFQFGIARKKSVGSNEHEIVRNGFQYVAFEMHYNN